MKNRIIVMIFLGGVTMLSSCKKEHVVDFGKEDPIIADNNVVNVTGTEWVRVEESYFLDKEIKGIGTVEGNMVLTFMDFIDQGTYFLSGHLSDDTTVVRHGLHYWPNGQGLEDIEIVDGKVYSTGYWDGNGLWEFKIDEINSLPYNSWDPAGAYGIQPKAFTIFGTEKIVGVDASPYVRSLSGNISFPDFDHSSTVRIHNLIEYKGDLICAGQFTSSNGTVLNNIARWNGSEWLALGNGVNGAVRDLEIFEGKLVVGGKFTAASGNTDCSQIAMWNGTSWEPMDKGLIGGFNGVHRIFVYENQLFAGGDFNGTTVINSENIIKWKNGNWIGLPNTVPEPVGEIGLYNGKLYVANKFHVMNGNFLMRLQ